MIYTTNFDFCALFIYAFITYQLLTKKSPNQKQNVIFLLLIVLAAIANISDLINARLLNLITLNDNQRLFSLLTPSAKRIWLNLTIYLYMLPHNILPFFFFLYITEITGISFKNSKVFYTIASIPAAIILLTILIINPISHAAFSFTEDLVYQRGPLLNLLYICSFIYLFAATFYIFSLRKGLSTSKLTGIFICMLLVIASIIIQFMWPYILLEMLIQSFGFLCLLVNIENEDEIYNPVTKVFNRNFFLSKTKTSIEAQASYKIVLIKILNLPYYNSILGTDFVNKVLLDIANWLISTVGKESVYDCDNGNFAVNLYGTETGKVAELEKAIYNRFSTTLTYDKIDLSLNIKLCVLDVPKMVNSVDTIMSIVNSEIQKTDIRISMLTDKEILLIKRRNAVEKAIQKALDTKTFQIYYQPIWDCKQNKIRSAEALLRLYDEKLGFITPEEFIPIAEKNGTIIQIGQIVFENACRFYSREQLHSRGIEFVEVNLSPVQCMHKNLATEFQEILQRYGVSAERINLEITETAAVNSPETFIQTVTELRNMRFKFSLDDYGIGYSNASHIFNMDFDFIKIDKSILWSADEKASARVVLNNTIEMIRQMNLKVIVEGVQTAEQKRVISGRGIDYIQGFYFSCPIPEKEFLQYVEDFNNGLLPQSR